MTDVWPFQSASGICPPSSDWYARQDSNLHCAPSEGAASYRLGYWRVSDDGERTTDDGCLVICLLLSVVCRPVGAGWRSRTSNLRITRALHFRCAKPASEDGRRMTDDGSGPSVIRLQSSVL